MAPFNDKVVLQISNLTKLTDPTCEGTHFMFKQALPLFFLFISTVLFSQTPQKTLGAARISDPPKIDGVLDDPVWRSLPRYGDFNMYQPGNEGSVPQGYGTEIQFAYDNKAVYVAAYMSDPKPSEIASQFSQRDNVNVQADVFSVALNTYNDGINETRFFVTSAGTIGDSRVTLGRQDFSYDVVFDCKIFKDEKGWYAEYRIPYNALRFPEKEIQDWSINFYRQLTNINEVHTWSLIENAVGRETQYNAPVTGVRDINPPIRLTFYPFVQGTATRFEGSTTSNLSAGMDVKYGLSDSFTLDATLIPDFGQASFDEVRLNLGPFEQTFGENRAFFTEGTDLFNKGRIFFSRRIGNSPTGGVGDTSEDEITLEYPSRVRLLNAVKISGRTEDKLGIGFLNTITEKTEAVLLDTLTGQRRNVLVEPIANYNVFVLDQQFNNNSSISLINTNVLRNGGFRDANASAFVFDVADKKNRFRTSGRAVMSYVNDFGKGTNGFLSELDIFRTKGNFRYRVGHDFSNRTFNINDLGLSFRNNFNNFVAGASYQIFEPTKTFNRYRIGITARHRRLYSPNIQTGNTLSANSFFALPNRVAFGLNVSYNSKSNDYFEPRVAGRFVVFEPSLGGNAFVSSDFRKKFAFNIGVGHRTRFNDPQRNMFFDFSPRYRFSDRFFVRLETNLSQRNREFGFVNLVDDAIVFGQRNITNIENAVSASFNFDAYKAINLRFRNFWSTADYTANNFTQLNENGTRDPIDYNLEDLDPNTNFNIWNLDLSFRWRFAPGSEAALLYRNQIFNQDNFSTLNYSESLGNLFEQPISNTFSLRITYFIDYNNVSYWFDRGGS